MKTFFLCTHCKYLE